MTNRREQIVELLKLFPDGLTCREISAHIDEDEGTTGLLLDRMFYKDLVRRVQESNSVKWKSN
jgi:DNA-binding IclR family transcriptional regulator